MTGPRRWRRPSRGVASARGLAAVVRRGNSQRRSTARPTAVRPSGYVRSSRLRRVGGMAMAVWWWRATDLAQPAEPPAGGEAACDSWRYLAAAALNAAAGALLPGDSSPLHHGPFHLSATAAVRLLYCGSAGSAPHCCTSITAVRTTLIVPFEPAPPVFSPWPLLRGSRRSRSRDAKGGGGFDGAAAGRSRASEPTRTCARAVPAQPNLSLPPGRWDPGVSRRGQRRCAARWRCEPMAGFHGRARQVSRPAA